MFIFLHRFSLGVHILGVGERGGLRLRASIVNDEDGEPLFQMPCSMCTTPYSNVIILDSVTRVVSCLHFSHVNPFPECPDLNGEPGNKVKNCFASAQP